VSTLDHMLEPEAATVRRLEVITGTGRRRRFSHDAKARIVEETLAPGAVVSEVARRHGLSPQQLFGWRRQARQPLETPANEDARLFVPAVVESAAVEAPLPAPLPRCREPKRARRADGISGIVEVEIDGVTVRVGRGADANTIAAVLRALKAGT
jgi:transposase